LGCRGRLATRSQKSGSAARPSADIAAVRDDAIGPGVHNVVHTVFDHRT
jgi:hypothetical protein